MGVVLPGGRTLVGLHVDPASGDGGSTLFVKTDASLGNTVTGAPEILHSFTIPGGTLAEDGDRIEVLYCGDYAADATCQCGLVWGGSAVATSGPVVDASGASFRIHGLFTRVTSTIVEWDLSHIVQVYSEAGSAAAMLGGPVNDEISGQDFDEDIVLAFRGLSDVAPGITLVRGGAKGAFHSAPA